MFKILIASEVQILLIPVEAGYEPPDWSYWHNIRGILTHPIFLWILQIAFHKKETQQIFIHDYSWEIPIKWYQDTLTNYQVHVLSWELFTLRCRAKKMITLRNVSLFGLVFWAEGTQISWIYKVIYKLESQLIYLKWRVGFDVHPGLNSAFLG